MIKKLYLTLYNAAQATLWSLALYKTLLPYVNAQFEFSAGPAAYVSGREMVEMAQSIAALEILHALLGITGGGPAAAIMQWAGRSNILFVALHFSRAAQTSPVAGLLFAAWALSEVIRYPWALLTTVKACPTWLTWLRYTAFIPLYPVGFVSEAFLLHTALPDLARQRVGIYPLPNPLNFSFDYPLLMKGASPPGSDVFGVIGALNF